MTDQIEIKSGKYNPFSALKVFYKIIHILTGLDYGFFEHKTLKKRVIQKMITLLQSIFLISLTVALAETFDGDKSDNWVLISLTHYFLNVLILISISPNKTFCQLHRDLKIIDLKLQASTATFKVEEIILISNIIALSLNMIISIYYCSTRNNCLKPALASMIFICLMISLYLTYTSCTFVFYSILCRLKYFSSVLKTENRDNSYMQNIYKEIVDLTDMQKSAIDPLLFLTIIYTTVGIMINILYSLVEMNKEKRVGLRTEHIEAVKSLVNMFAPALAADALTRQSSKIVQILHEKLIHERDPGRQRELERFIRYVEARPLQFRIYRVIPLDASLLGMVLNFVVTYLIVIVQFAFKY